MGKIIHNYKCGQKHIALGKNCEDRTYAMTLNDVSVIALADGAGSEKYTHSGIGAECVVEVACRFLCKNFDRILTTPDEECKNAFVSICQSELSEKANELGLDSIMYLSSTLLAVAVKGNDTIIFHIGDGVIGKYTIDGFSVVSAPDNGEFVGTTYFMTLADASNRLTMLREHNNDVTAYFVMSDGVSEYVYDEVNRVFTDAVVNFINMADDIKGSALLGDAMQKYIIDTNPTSDDCSFACLKLVASRAEMGGYVPATEYNTEVFAEYPTDQAQAVGRNQTATPPFAAEYKQGKPVNNKKPEKLSPVFIIVVVLAFILAIILGRVVGGFLGDNSSDDNEPAFDINETAVPQPTYLTEEFSDEISTEEETSETTEDETSEEYEETEKESTTKSTTTEKQNTTNKPTEKPTEKPAEKPVNNEVVIPDVNGFGLKGKIPDSDDSNTEETKKEDKNTDQKLK